MFFEQIEKSKMLYDFYQKIQCTIFFCRKPQIFEVLRLLNMLLRGGSSFVVVLQSESGSVM